MALSPPNPTGDPPALRTTYWRSRDAWPLFLFAFGFLLASFPARNLDLWSHLAAGRDIAQHATLGQSFTPCFDLGVYLCNSLGGGFGVVFAKALAMGLLGIVLYVSAKCAGSGTLPAVLGGLSLMALSLRANLQPQTASYLFLGLLQLWSFRNSRPPTRLADWLPLLLLFGFWANFDRGFVYGAAAFGLILIGRDLDTCRRPVLARWIVPILVVGGLFALNPAHWAYAFRGGRFPLPLELEWMRVGTTRELLRTPFATTYLSAIRDNPAALAYYPLVALTLLGFVSNRRAFRWEHFLPSLAFTLLSAITDRAIPLFAVVCGPIAARNLGEALLRSRVSAPPQSRGARYRWGVSLAKVLLAGIFLVAVWPGWLQRPPYEPRRWVYDWPSSPAAGSEFLRGLLQSGTERDHRTLHLAPESHTAFRWFCPEDDGRLDGALSDRLLQGQSINDEMRAGGFTRVVLYHPNREQLRPALNVLLRDRYRWPLLYVGGDVAIFGWRDPKSEIAYPHPSLDLTREWNESLERKQSLPMEGPSLAVPTWQQSLRKAFTEPKRTQSRNRAEAALLLMIADLSQAWIPQSHGQSWAFEHVAGLVGAAGSPNPLHSITGSALRLSYISPPAPEQRPPLFQTVDRQFDFAMATKDDYLTGALAAATRSGRRAVAEIPDDANAYLTLGEAYLKVLFDSRERVWNAEFKQLRELRQAQAVTTLTQAIRCGPNPPVRAHLLLSNLYGRINYLDLSLEQMLAVKKANVKRSADDPELDKITVRLQQRVKQSRERFDLESAGMRVLDQAVLADELSLPGLALELLLKSDISVFGSAGLKLQLELMVRTGRAQQVIEWTAPEQLDAVGLRNYHWWRAQAFAGLGDYRSADEELVEIGGGAFSLIPDPDFLSTTTTTLVAKNLLGEAPHGTGLHDAVWRLLARSDAVNELRTMESRLKNLAEVSVLRGVLSLEVGDGPAARERGKEAVFFSPQRSGGVYLPLHIMGQSLLDRTKALAK